METDGLLHFATWLLGGIGAVFLFLFALWWKIENKQDQKIDALAERNGKEHLELHTKIDLQHHQIRDRLDTIWKHIRHDD